MAPYIINHELGHPLLGSGEHQEGTFMRPGIQADHNVVTEKQAKALRTAAYGYGGY